LVLNDFVPKVKGYEYKNNIDYQLMQSADTAKGGGFNFEPITFEDKPENVMQNLFLSVKNLRKNLVIDSTSRKQVEIA